MQALLDQVLKQRGQLADVVLGQALPASALPERAAEEARGTVSGDGVGLSVTAGIPFGTVQWVTVEFSDLDNRATADALFAALRKRVPTHFGGTAHRDTRTVLELRTTESTVVLSRFRQSTDDGEFDSVTLRLELERAAQPKAQAHQLGFDVTAVAKALATTAFPASVVEPRLIARFTRPEWEADPEWAQVLTAARTEHATRLPSVVEAVLRAAPFTNDFAQEPAMRLLKGLMPRVLDYRPTRAPHANLFTDVTMNDVVGIARECSSVGPERAEFAALTYRALELGDETAAAKVRAVLKVPLVLSLAFDGRPEHELRLFDLLAQTLPDPLDQLLLPFRTSTSNAALAGARWFAAKLGVTVPTVKVSVRGDWQLASTSLATYFAFVQQHLPQHFDAAAARFSQRPGLYNPDIIGAVCGAAGTVVSKTMFDLAATRFTVRGSRVSAAPAPVKAVKPQKPKKKKK